MSGPASGLELLWLWRGPLAWGLFSTLMISFCAYGIGLVAGFLGAVGKISGPPGMARLLGWYTTIFRAMPELLLIVFLYYLATSLINAGLARLGIGAISINGFVAAVAVLGIVQGAYQTEVQRGAMLSVPKGQLEAARAYGMSPFQIYRRILIPAMLPNALPGLANQWLNVTKDSSLIAVVGYAELLLISKQAAGASQVKHYFLFFSFAAVLYLLITLVSLWGFGKLERHMRRGQVRTVQGGA